MYNSNCKINWTVHIFLSFLTKIKWVFFRIFRDFFWIVSIFLTTGKLRISPFRLLRRFFQPVRLQIYRDTSGMIFSSILRPCPMFLCSLKSKCFISIKNFQSKKFVDKSSAYDPVNKMPPRINNDAVVFSPKDDYIRIIYKEGYIN